MGAGRASGEKRDVPRFKPPHARKAWLVVHAHVRTAVVRDDAGVPNDVSVSETSPADTSLLCRRLHRDRAACSSCSSRLPRPACCASSRLCAATRSCSVCVEHEADTRARAAPRRPAEEWATERQRGAGNAITTRAAPCTLTPRTPTHADFSLQLRHAVVCGVVALRQALLEVALPHSLTRLQPRLCSGRGIASPTQLVLQLLLSVLQLVLVPEAAAHNPPSASMHAMVSVAEPLGTPAGRIPNAH